MTWPRHATIFWRTFLLSLTALVIAEGVGLALSGAQSGPEEPPVSLGDVARWLTNNNAVGVQAGPPGAMGPPNTNPQTYTNPQNRGPPLPPGVSGGPPGGLDGPPGPPPDLAPGGLQSTRRKLILTDAAQPPAAPSDVDDAASSRLTGLLATRLGLDQQHVRLYVKKAGLFDASGGSPMDEDEQRLREGFVAGFERSRGQWKVLEDQIGRAHV